MFVIVRHGNTFEQGTRPRRVGARTDLPLTPAGIEQAKALGRLFAERGMQFDRVLSSPLLRTRQTAEAILAQQCDAPSLEPCEFLREVDYGPDEDKTEDVVFARIGRSALDAWEKHALVPAGWIVNPEERIAGWKELFSQQRSPEKPMLLVTSNGAARFALMADANLKVAAEKLETLKLPTGGFGLIERDSGGELRLREWGKRP